ncbi:MAG: hypothetical protein ACRC6U_06660 [Fusobacteriaceae bacterium]
MGKGGKRINSGRKKIPGEIIRVKIDYETLDKLKEKIDGNCISDKIRNCINIILEGEKK